MSKGKEKFRDVWVNQTTLGKTFNLSAVAVGKKLKELDLREDSGTPTEKALLESYCKDTPLKDGKPFFLWHKKKVGSLLRESGLQTLSEQEVRSRDIAKEVMDAERLDNEGEDKAAKIMYDCIYEEIKSGDIPVINRFLKEFGSKIELD